MEGLVLEYQGNPVTIASVEFGSVEIKSGEQVSSKSWTELMKDLDSSDLSKFITHVVNSYESNPTKYLKRQKERVNIGKRINRSSRPKMLVMQPNSKHKGYFILH